MSIARFTGRGVVLFYRGFVDLGCGVTGSLMLSQALYWDQNEAAQKRGGWFYKTQDEWAKETGMSRREQETARKRLKELGFIEEKRQGVPAKIWFRVCVNQIDLAVQTSMAECANLGCTKAPDCNGGMRQSITETTTEITTKTTSLCVSKPKKRFAPPTQTEVYEHMISKEASQQTASHESEMFVNFYESKGWVVGKAKMKNWKAASTNWLNRNKNRGYQQQPTRQQQQQQELAILLEQEMRGQQ